MTREVEKILETFRAVSEEKEATLKSLKEVERDLERKLEILLEFCKPSDAVLGRLGIRTRELFSNGLGRYLILVDLNKHVIINTKGWAEKFSQEYLAEAIEKTAEFKQAQENAAEETSLYKSLAEQLVPLLTAAEKMFPPKLLKNLKELQGRI